MSANTGFCFDKVAFFGRGVNEYVKMFDLDLDSLSGKIVLDCCAVPAAFALEAHL
jgi:hypothetical protein